MQTNQTKQFKSSKIRTSFKIGKQEVLEWWQAKKIYLKKKNYVGISRSNISF